MQKKKDIFARAVSTGVLTNSVFFFVPFCVSFNSACFAENTIKIGVSAKTKQNTKKCCVKNRSKVVLKIGPIMLCNKIGPVFNTTFWSFFFNLLIFFENTLLSAGRTRFSKTNNKLKKWTSF